jgi:hypothetical protein
MPDTREQLAELDAARQKVDVDAYNIIVRELIGMTERGELHRAPEYQRKFRWNQETESRLIESLLLGLPVPNIFVATNEDGSWEVVDGLQRISTLLHFTTSEEPLLKELGKTESLRLTGLRTLTTFNDLTFAELPPAIRMAFTKRGLGITALSDKSDPETRYATFERLNRGSVQLSPQEIRACIYEGSLNALLKELADTPDFHSFVKLQEKEESDATREELVLKFFAYLNDRDNFKGGVDTFLSAYMQKYRATFDVEEGRREFLVTVDALRNVSPVPFLRSNTNVTPKIELEAAMIATADLLRAGKQLRVTNPDWVDDPTLIEASTGATNTRKKLRERVARAAELLCS